MDSDLGQALPEHPQKSAVEFRCAGRKHKSCTSPGLPWEKNSPAGWRCPVCRNQNPPRHKPRLRPGTYPPSKEFSLNSGSEHWQLRLSTEVALRRNNPCWIAYPRCRVASLNPLLARAVALGGRCRRYLGRSCWEVRG